MPGALVAGLTALALVLGERNELNHYDQYWALLQGRELADGDAPAYESLGASTPHPLTIGISALLSLAGRDGARDLLEVVNVTAWAVVVVGCGVIAASLLNRVAGVFAGLAVATNLPLFEFTVSGSADALLVAPLVAAVAIEVRRPRAGLPVLILLLIGGLTRPEAWLFAGVYWLWLAPRSTWRRRARDAALVVAAPIVWIATDALATGDPLFSMHYVQDATAEFLPTGADAVIPELYNAVQALLEVPELLGALVAVALLARLRSRRALVPAAVCLGSLLGFAVLGVAELAMLPRYLLPAAAFFSAAAGAVLAGWVGVPGRDRVLFGLAALLVAGAYAYRAPDRVDAFAVTQEAHRERNFALADLRRVLERMPRTTCDIWTGYQFKSYVAYQLEVHPDRVRVFGEGAVDGVVVVPVARDALEAYSLSFAGPPAPWGAQPTLVRGRVWRAAVAGCPDLGVLQRRAA